MFLFGICKTVHVGDCRICSDDCKITSPPGGIVCGIRNGVSKIASLKLVSLFLLLEAGEGKFWSALFISIFSNARCGKTNFIENFSRFMDAWIRNCYHPHALCTTVICCKGIESYFFNPWEYKLVDHLDYIRL